MAVAVAALASVIGSIPAVSAFTLEGQPYQNTDPKRTAIGYDWLVLATNKDPNTGEPVYKRPVSRSVVVAPLGTIKTEFVSQPTSFVGSLYTDYFIFKYKDGDTVPGKPVPEPLTILGSITAAGFGVAFKRKKNSKKDQEDA